jgi:hypothetical protein
MRWFLFTWACGVSVITSLQLRIEIPHLCTFKVLNSGNASLDVHLEVLIPVIFQQFESFPRNFFA